MTTDYISLFTVLQIRTKLAAQVGDSFDVLNIDSLKSALAAPRQSMFGEDLNPTVWDKAATLLFLLIKNHPFYDGNKRIAMLAVTEFLRRNGWILEVSPEEAARFSTRIATSDVTSNEIIQWLQGHARRTAA
jgi:death-on-curing protein